MFKVIRWKKNPILTPQEDQGWEAAATFNGSIVFDGKIFRLVYRATSFPHLYFDKEVPLSTIGLAESKNGVDFYNRRPLFAPEYPWEQFGCEDPRITKLGNKYFIFYTALSSWPPAPADIKIGVAITTDFLRIEKHQVTDFNSKAMALFPQKIKGKIVGILTVNTDLPPAKIALAFFDNFSQIWEKEFWHRWLLNLSKYVLPLQRSEKDQVEVGAPPLRTKNGWLLLYSYIRNYLSPPSQFGVEAVLLDLANPLKIIGRTPEPILVPTEEYEIYGRVGNVVFPSGAFIKNEKIYLYYGAADTTCCLATMELKELLGVMTKKSYFFPSLKLERYSGNPIIKPRPENSWESVATFNPGAIFVGGKVHLLYRAMGKDQTSVFGYASSSDGFNFNQRLNQPVYFPREDFEKKAQPGLPSGCEDPRLTLIGNKIYMCYTAFDGKNPWKVALTSINLTDFLAHRWRWQKPICISHPERSDKNACLLEEKVGGYWVFFHRVGHCIWIDFVEDLEFKDNWLGGKIILWPRPGKWDSHKIGITGPPHKTRKGWLLLYHGLSAEDKKYRLGAVLLDLRRPDRVLIQLDKPILEPETDYEVQGSRPGTVFSCGSIVKDGQLLVYYGAGDSVIGVASIELEKLIKRLA